MHDQRLGKELAAVIIADIKAESGANPTVAGIKAAAKRSVLSLMPDADYHISVSDDLTQVSITRSFR